jgi:cell wall-associated NlpC family hydrolase
MATTHVGTRTSRTARSIRTLTLVLAGAVGVVLAPSPATAEEPATSQEAAALVAAKGHELEVVTEQFNEAREQLAAAQAAAADAAAKAAQAQADLTTAQGNVVGVARSAYTGEGLTSLEAMMTSGSADEFVDRVATLQTIAGHQNQVLDTAAQANAAAATARQTADQTAAGAQQQLAAVTAQQSDLQAQIADYQADFQRLSAEEQRRAQELAEQHAAAVAAQQQADTSARAGADRASRSERTAPAADDDASAPSAPVSAGAGSGAAAVQAAMAQRGKPYVWAASGPSSFDCSGLMQYAWNAAGVSLPHSSSMQARMGTAVSRSQLQPGDLVFFYSPISHVGMYIGNGMVVHAANPSDGVEVSPLHSMPYSGAVRPG